MDVLDCIATDGFVLGPALDAPAVDRLRDGFLALGLDEDHPYFASNVHCGPDQARQVDVMIRAELVPLLGDLLPGYRPFLAAFISKGSRTGSRIAFHQDWTYTDERSADTVLVWMPLVDVDEHNGALSVVAGSHLWSRGVRPAPGHEPGERYQQALAEVATQLPMPAGHMVMYSPAALHGSVPNLTDRVRPAAAIAFAPEAAPLVHFHQGPDGLTGFVVDDQYFLDGQFSEPPSGYAEFDPWARAVRDDEFDGPLQALASRRTGRTQFLRGRRSSPWRRRRSSSAAD